MTGGTYIAPIRNATIGTTGTTGPTPPTGTIGYPDCIMVYDPFNPVFLTSANATYEVSWARHSMFLATFYLPPLIDPLLNWQTYGVSAVTRLMRTNPFGNKTVDNSGILECQNNLYSYYLVPCGINSITSAILTAGSTSASIPAILTASGGVGLYAVLSGAQYAAAAYLYLMFSDDNAVVGAPRTYCNTCWSASIEWLNDPRSRYINNGTEYRIMLLGANHSF